MFVPALYFQLWPFKILTSPAPQAILICLGTLALSSIGWFLLNKGRARIAKIAGAGIILAVFCTFTTLNLQPPLKVSSRTPNNQIAFTTYNRLFTTNDIQLPADYIGQQGSDIISLQEVLDPNYAQDFAKLAELDHYVQSTGNDVALVSRWPITSSEFRQNVDRQVLRAEVDSPYGTIVVYAVHISPPFTLTMYRDGLQELKNLQGWIAAETLPVVVGGDYNTAIYAPEMRSYTSAIAGKVIPTTEQRWPECSWFGFGGISCLRIDHAFIPATANFYGSTVSPDLGSDHRAVTVKFSL